MCGILGLVIDPGRAALPDKHEFTGALDMLAARGPDDQGFWTDARCVQLGHRRLSVIDTSRNAAQPMLSHDGRYALVYNGEIYNHLELREQLAPASQWRSRSDTETLLEAYRRWGVRCLDHLDGMFAFAIWDAQERSLFLARDRMGKKPLYYARFEDRLLFASRPAPLLRLLGPAGREFDEDALRAYLELGHIPAPLSLHRAIRKLPQAHYLLLREGQGRPVRYWEYRHLAPQATSAVRDEGALADELDDLLRSAVKKRLISDVPVGAFLSSGIDSTAILAAMRAEGLAVPAVFTIGLDDPRKDESVAARRIARMLGDVEHSVEVLSTDDLLALLPDYLRAFDEPSADTSAFPTLAVARLARRKVKVVLTGDGGDELFGGYPYYRWVGAIGRLQRHPALRRLLARGLRRVPRHRAQLVAGALAHDDVVTLFHFLRSFGKDFPSLLHADARLRTTSSRFQFEQFAASLPLDLAPAEIGMRLDANFMLADGYFQKVDLATMAFSLEARCPFADHRLVEWAMQLPLSFKLRGGTTKLLLRKVLSRHLPADLVNLPKRGFGVPMAQWLRGPLRGWAEALLHDPHLLSSLPLDREAVLNLFRLHLSGARDAHPLLWAVLMLLGFVARERDYDIAPQIPALAA